MPLRSARERVVQTLLYEAIGLVLVAPVCAVFWGGSLHDSGMLLAVLAVIVMLWTALFNTAFDWAELRWTGRVASDRPKLWRGVHAITLEVSACMLTLPVTIAMTGLSVWGALWLEVWLTAAYAAYALVFHTVYDRMRPVVSVSGVQSRHTSRPEAAW